MIRKFKQYTPVVPDSCYIFSNATIIGNVTLGENVIVYPGTVIRGEHHSITIGNNTNFQENCTVHIEAGYDVHIGNGVTIGHNAIIHACTIHDNVLIGMGSIIQDGVVIGENCFIGAGAVLRRGMVVEPGSMVYGVPARRIRDITQAEYLEIRESVEEYQIARLEFKAQDLEEKEEA